jgi:predicted nucleotidyltransferase
MSAWNDRIAEWAANKVSKEYPGDVSLLLAFGSYVNGTENLLSDVDMFFIPKTDKAYGISKSFITEGVGYDIFAMTWDRMEDIADFRDSLTPCLGDSKVLWYGSPEDLKRFEELKNRLKEHLADGAYMAEMAAKKLRAAKNLYGTMVFEDSLGTVRVCAGSLLTLLSLAVAYGNRTYFRRGQKKQLEDLSDMPLPEGFIALYMRIVEADTAEGIMTACRKAVEAAADFLDRGKPEAKRAADYKALGVLYQEIISAWNKIYICCKNNDMPLCFQSGVNLQRELDQAAEENGLAPLDLMGFFDPSDPEGFAKRAKELQDSFVSVIESGGYQIESYDTVGDFLENN